MKINEILAEQEQLDELSLKGLGTGLGKVVGAPVGAAVQGAKNVWSGVKQGYAAGQNALAPDGKPAPASAGTTASQSATAPADDGASPAPSDDDASQAPVASTATAPAGSTATAPASAKPTNTTPVSSPAKSAKEIASTLRDIHSNQANPISAPAVTQEIVALAKAAGMTGQTIKENDRTFSSKFLGMMI